MTLPYAIGPDFACLDRVEPVIPKPEKKGWIGVDLDGTLAEYHGWSDNIGAPIPAMVERVKAWLAAGEDVRILTARGTGGGSLHNAEQWRKIADWCRNVFGRSLPITDRKDCLMTALYDDRAIGVEKNTGRLVADVAYKNGYDTGKMHAGK